MADPAHADISSHERQMAAWFLCPGHRIVWQLAMLPALVWLMVFFYLRDTTGSPFEAVKESEAAVEDWLPEDLPDASLNAAPLYDQAQEAFKPFNEKIQPGLHPKAWKFGPWPAWDDPEVAAWLKANQPVAELLLRAADVERCVWPETLEEVRAMTIGDHHRELRSLRGLLSVLARHCAHEGRHQEASRYIRAITRMGDHVSQLPGVLALGVSDVFYTEAVYAFESILLWESPGSDVDLVAYESALPMLSDPWSDAASALAVEQDLIQYVIDYKTVEMLRNMESRIGLRFPGRMRLPLYGDMRDTFTKSMEYGINQFDLKLCIENEFNYRWLAPYSKKFAGGQQHVAALHISLAEYRLRVADMVTCAHVGLAWSRYRLAHRADPGSLEDLVPTFLDRTPVDAYHAKPINFRVDPDGLPFNNAVDGTSGIFHRGVIRIYSFGKNGEDDRGYAPWHGKNPEREGPSSRQDTPFWIPPLAAPATDNSAQKGGGP